MDSEFWTSRLAAAKRQFSHQNAQIDRLSMDDLEVDEEEVRPEFPCPYCYEEFDIGSLCVHLEDEHICETRVTVCPICSVKIARNMLSHITLQHGHLFKLQRRRRLRRVPVPSSQALSLLGRDLREAHLQVLLGGSGFRSSTNPPPAAALNDPLLSSLVMNFPSSEVEDISKSLVSSLEDTPPKSTPLQRAWKSSFDSSLTVEEREKRMRQAAAQAAFVQDLFASTLLAEFEE